LPRATSLVRRLRTPPTASTARCCRSAVSRSPRRPLMCRRSHCCYSNRRPRRPGSCHPMTMPRTSTIARCPSAPRSPRSPQTHKDIRRGLRRPVWCRLLTTPPTSTTAGCLSPSRSLRSPQTCGCSRGPRRPAWCRPLTTSLTASTPVGYLAAASSYLAAQAGQATATSFVPFDDDATDAQFCAPSDVPVCIQVAPESPDV